MCVRTPANGTWKLQIPCINSHAWFSRCKQGMLPTHTPHVGAGLSGHRQLSGSTGAALQQRGQLSGSTGAALQQRGQLSGSTGAAFRQCCASQSREVPLAKWTLPLPTAHKRRKHLEQANLPEESLSQPSAPRFGLHKHATASPKGARTISATLLLSEACE